VQLQRQVIRLLPEAYQEYEAMGRPLPSKDSLDLDEEAIDTAKVIANPAIDPIKKQERIAVEWDGLDPGPRNVDKIKRKKKEVDELIPEPVLTDAIVTIDSSLLRDEPFIDEEGNEVKRQKKRDKALERKIKALSDLNKIPFQSLYDDLLFNCRRATLQVEFVDSASSYLYELLVDTLHPGQYATQDVLDQYEEALEYFREKNISAAKNILEPIVAKERDYYPASMLLADCYYLLDKDSAAISIYSKVGLLRSSDPLPFEKLSLLFYNRGQYEEAAKWCIKAISTYPKDHYFELLRLIVSKNGKAFNTQWLRREVYPLSTARNYFEITALDKTPWWQYQSADADVHGYYDTLGLVRPNDKTKIPYLELYAWKKMLDDTKKEVFPFARAMDKLGLLECYVLITCFHHDLYGQLAHFVKRHPEKVQEYFYVLINWEDKKFEKLRKKFMPAEAKKESEKESEKGKPTQKEK
jgi:tetratricopeptide (TPR) repeat protein